VLAMANFGSFAEHLRCDSRKWAEMKSALRKLGDLSPIYPNDKGCEKVANPFWLDMYSILQYMVEFSQIDIYIYTYIVGMGQTWVPQPLDGWY